MIYRSRNPLMFGINQDERYLVSTLPLAAPEIVSAGNEDFIAFLEPTLNGIRLARLDWIAD